MDKTTSTDPLETLAPSEDYQNCLNALFRGCEFGVGFVGREAIHQGLILSGVFGAQVHMTTCVDPLEALRSTGDHIHCSNAYFSGSELGVAFGEGMIHGLSVSSLGFSLT